MSYRLSTFAAACLLSGCASNPGFAPAIEPAAAVLAACPPLSQVQYYSPDALGLRVAELERWYAACRETATRGTPARAPRFAWGQP